MTPQEFVNRVKELSKKECYEVKPARGKVGIVDDKIGGIPYLPLGVEYPKDIYGKDMQLLLQLNFANIELEDYPDHGILELFIDGNLYSPSIVEVKYFESVDSQYREDISDINIAEPLVSNPIKICYNKVNDYTAYSIEGGEKDYILQAIQEIDENAEELGDVFPNDSLDICNELYCSPKASIGGYPEYMQYDMRERLNVLKQAYEEVKADIKSGEITAEGFESLVFARFDEININKRVSDVYDKYNDVVCLFKLSADFSRKIEGMYGGVMSCLIPRQSLAERKFEDIFISYDFD